jgi:hypothetical protein
MALQQKDQKEKFSLRRFWDKNMGYDDDILTPFENACVGMYRMVTLGQRREFFALMAAATTVIGGGTGAVYLENHLDNQVNWQPEYAVTQTEDHELLGYNITLRLGDSKQTRNYTLYENEAGEYSLLSSNDDNPYDDILYPVASEIKNSTIAAEIVTRLHDYRAALGDGSTAAEDSGLHLRQYEGFSHAFTYSADPQTTYIIGDNETKVTALTSAEIDAQLERWNAALDQFMQQPNVPLETIGEASHPDDNTNPIALFGLYAAGMLGFGAAAGFANGVVGSRKRYNQKNRLKR